MALEVCKKLFETQYVATQHPPRNTSGIFWGSFPEVLSKETQSLTVTVA